MGDFETKVTLIKIDVDQEASKREVEKLTGVIIAQTDAVKANNDEISSLNKENKELQKQVKAGTITQEEASKAIAENNKRAFEIKKTNAAVKDGLKDLNKERASAVKATKLQANSLDALRKKSVDLKKQLNAQETATDSGRKKFDELTIALEKNNSQITELDQAAGDFKTTVGQYKKELGGAEKGTKIFGGALDGVTKMILLNPFAIIVGALVALVAIFKESQTGAEFFRKAGAALNVVFGLMSDIVEELGGSIIKAFDEPKKTFDDLVTTIKDGIFKYFTEFIPNAIKTVIGGFKLLADALISLDFDKAVEGSKMLVDGLTDIIPGTALAKTAFESLTPAIAEFTKQVLKGTDAAFQLEQQLIANEKATSDQEVTVAQTIATQKELNRIIEDQTKTFAERLAAGEEFAAIESEQVAESLRLQEERVRILKAQNDITNSTEEDIQRVRDAEIKLAQLRAASDEVQVTNANKLFGIRQQQETESLKAKETEQKAEEALNQRLAELQEGRRLNAQEVRLAEAEDLAESLELQKEIEDENFELDQERLLEKEAVLAENKLISDEERMIAQGEIDLQFEELKQTHSDNILSIADKQAKEEVKTTKKKTDKLLSIEKSANRATQKGIDIANSLVQSKFTKRFADLQAQFDQGLITEEQFAFKKEQLEKKQALAAYNIQKKTFLANKILTIADIVVNTAKGIAQAIGSFPPPASFVMAAITGALGTAQTIAVALQQPPPAPTFAQGGDVFGFVSSGKSHSAGGETWRNDKGGAFNIQGDEGVFITKREATNPALEMLDQANTGAGGRSMFASSSRFLQDGGEATTEANNEATRQLIEEVLAGAPTPVVQVQSIQAGINAENEANQIGVI